MKNNRFPVEVLLPDGSVINGFIRLSFTGYNHDPLMLELKFMHRSLDAVAYTIFDALKLLRLQLEPEGIMLLCNGACENVVYIAYETFSPMPEVNDDLYAPVLKMGERPKMKHQKNMFDYDPALTPVTVQEQEAFYQKWLKSLEQK